MEIKKMKVRKLARVGSSEFVRPMYLPDEVTRTKPANKEIHRLDKLLKREWKRMLKSGWKKWQVRQLMHDAVRHTGCWIDLLYERPNGGTQL